MNIKDILSSAYAVLSKLSKNRLPRAIQSLREQYIQLEEKTRNLKQKMKPVNMDANMPS